MATSQLNYYANYVGSFIILLVFLVGIVIIIDEIYNVCRFCYRYTYLYNYGTLNEATCKDNKLECETARFKIYNELPRYKFDKDIFTKTWVNYSYFITIIFLSILLCISFAYLFKHLFIDNNQYCVITKDTPIQKWSIIKVIMRCFCNECHEIIPNCFMSYLMVAILLFIYPMIYILKVIFKLDYTWSAGSSSKLFHTGFFIGLLVYIYYLFLQEDTAEDKVNSSGFLKPKYIKMIIYVVYIGIFYANNYFFATKFDEYSKLSLITNPTSKINIEDPNNDATFFDIYKQEEPTKPKEIERPSFLWEFKFCNSNELKHGSNDYCKKMNKLSMATDSKYPRLEDPTYKCAYSNENNKIIIDDYIKNKNYYEIDKLIINDYYKKLDKYEKDMKLYNYKYNIYKNNSNKFPEIVFFLFHLCPKMVGIDKREMQLLFVLIVFIVILTAFLRSTNSPYTTYVYYTIFLYLLGLISISMLINATLIYNTYVNKYLIYEPCHNYKNALYNKSILLNAIVKGDSSLNSLYELNTGEKIKDSISTRSDLTQFKIKNSKGELTNTGLDGFINEYKNNKNLFNTNDNINFYNAESPITPATINNDLLSVQFKFLRTIYSSFLNIEPNNTNLPIDNIQARFIINTNPSLLPYNKMTNYLNSLESKHLIVLAENTIINTGSAILDSTDIFYYMELIKTNFISNENNIKLLIDQLKINYEYYIYVDTTIYDNTNNENNIVNLSFNIDKFIDKRKIYYKKDIDKDNKNNNKNIIKHYIYNKPLIERTFNIYGEFLQEIRKIFINLLNNCNISCDYTDFIDIKQKYNELINKLFIISQSKIAKFKSTSSEPNIVIYKKLLANSMNQFNEKFIYYFNLIKIHIKAFKPKPDIAISDISLSGTAAQRSIAANTKNYANEEKTYSDIEKRMIINYNIYNLDALRHTNETLNKRFLNMDSGYSISKYTNMNIIDLKKMKLSCENVSMSFIILIIIFAIILIEPTVI